MQRNCFQRSMTLALAAGLAIAASTVQAQPAGSTGANLPPASGSGVLFPGGPTIGGGMGRGGPVPFAGTGRSAVPAAHFPDDPALIPLDVFLESGSGEGRGSDVQTVTPDLVEIARAIDEPSERSLALKTIAEAAIFTNQLSVAHVTLGEAATAALPLPDSLVRDQRLIAIITGLINLAEANIREGKLDMSILEPDEKGKGNRPDRITVVKRAKLEWQRAAYLAGRIGNITYRSEMLYRVVDSSSYGSEIIINEYAPPAGPDATEKPKSNAPNQFHELADAILQQSADDARYIERPVWRDRALVTIAENAASSRQFARALEVARMIPQPEVRTDALVKIAETQARNDHQEDATKTYHEAAEAVASIPLEDPRAVLVGVLIDNLITVGRFEDARICSDLYGDETRKYLALGAVAESQGRRGQSPNAMKWIAADVPETHRAQLYRRVKDGTIAAIEQNRARALSNQSR